MTVMGHQSFFETEKSPQTRMNTKKKGLTSFLSTLHGGVQDFKSEPKAAETSANDTVWVPFL